MNIPTTREEYESPEVQDHLRKMRAYEAAVAPHAYRVWEQYKRGLITFWEMIEAMTEIDLLLQQHGDRRCGYEYGGYAPCQKFPDHAGLHVDANGASFETQ